MTEAPKRKKRNPFKLVKCTGTVSGVLEDGKSILEDLASECREIVDNASEGLSQTQRIQTLDETASSLEGICFDVDLPDALAELAVEYVESLPTDKRRSPSRATRCANAVAMLQSGLEAIEQWLDENPEHEDRDEVDSFKGDIESAISDAEGCEFPGMFG